MAQQIPTQFDPVALCRRTDAGASSFVGEIAVDQFERLGAVLSETAGPVAVELTFERLESGRPAARGRLRASLPLTCQRCLQTCWSDIETDFHCCFASSEAVAERMPDDLDVLMMDEKGKVSLSDLFEDELLLALPIFPKHGEGGCAGDVAERLEALSVSEQAPEAAEQATRKAFAGLDQLLDLDKKKPDGGH